jgi:hypothetical protein
MVACRRFRLLISRRDNYCSTIESRLISRCLTMRTESSLNRNGILPQNNDRIADIPCCLILTGCPEFLFHIQRYFKVHCYKTFEIEPVIVPGSREDSKGESHGTLERWRWDDRNSVRIQQNYFLPTNNYVLKYDIWEDAEFIKERIVCQGTILTFQPRCSIHLPTGNRQPVRRSFKRKSFETALSSPTRLCSMNFGCDYFPSHFVSVWIIPHHNQFQSRSTLLC